MPSLIFVRDAAETPLMPLSPAYARVLVRSNKAVWATDAHPALPVLQLTHTHPAPHLPPLLLAVRVADHHATLAFCWAHQSHAPCVIAVQLDPAPPPEQSLSALEQLEALRVTIAHLLPFAPISHIALIPAPAARHAQDDWVLTMAAIALADLTSAPISVLPPTGTATHLPAALAQALHQMLPALDAYPASVIGSVQGVILADAANEHSWGGRLTTPRAVRVRHQRRVYTGVLRNDFELRPPGLVVKYATAGGLHGIDWKVLSISRSDIIQTWPATAVVLLPVVRDRSNRRRAP
jgi:hypothetical protein